MSKKLIIILILISACFPLPVMAAGTEPTAYYSDAEFDEYYNTQKEGFDTGKRSKLELLQFIYGKHCSYSQLHKILEDGYFTEYIDRFKASGLLEEDYELPSSVTVHPTDIDLVEGGSDEHKALTDVEGTTLKHELEDFSIENENNIAALLQDTDPADAYVTLPVSLEDKKIHGFLVSHSFYNSEPLGIAFADGDKIAYAWNFKDVLFRGADQEQIDLSVKSDTSDNGSLSFSLENIDGEATLHIPLAEDDRDKDYSILDEDGNVLQTAEPDEYGFVTLTGLKGTHTYTVKRGLMRVKGEGEENINNDGPSWKDSVHISKLIMIPVLIILVGVGIALMVIGIKKSHK